MCTKSKKKIPSMGIQQIKSYTITNQDKNNTIIGTRYKCWIQNTALNKLAIKHLIKTILNVYGLHKNHVGL